MRPKGQQKADRLNLIASLLWKRAEGWTTRELARELGVTPRTIQRDLDDLQAEAYRMPLVKRGTHWALLAGSQPLLSALRLTLPEATALGLAARLLQRASDETNPHITAALAKLVGILPGQLGEHLQRFLPVGAGTADREYVSGFEALAQSWARRQSVHLRYQPANATDELESDFDVYCLEPIAPSLALYAIGYAHVRGEVRTLKLERILSAELTDRPFEVQPGFDAAAYLQSGWGIMGGAELQTVRLRVAAEAVPRLRESRFHPSQEVEEEPGGSCLVTFRVAHPVELSAFIRGWGPRVEVLEPLELRGRIAREVREMGRLYGST